MAEEEAVAPVPASETSPVPSDLKRKLEDLEPEAPEPTETLPEPQVDSSAEPDADKTVDNVAEDALPEAKRPKLDETKSDELASANGFDGEQLEEHTEEDAKEPSANNEQVEDASHPSSEGVTETAPKEEQSAGDQDTNDTEKVTSVEVSNNDETDGKQDIENHFEGTEDPESDKKPTSRKIDVPNDKVGVLIGKGGDTIRYLQINSGARIQITRDAESDPHSTTRPVELIGTPSSISQAEKLITAVIAEADAGGSPSLVARGIQSAQAAGVGDQLEMQVPNEKVGLIIGRGGDTIKALQTKSGARIQLIPQHLPEGDPSKERIVRITGNRRQIDIASSMIKDVMSQNVKQSPYSGGYSQQQSYRPRGPTGPSNWGPRGGPHSSQQNPYDYHHPHRGPYPSQTSQYPSPNYGGYPQQQMGPRGSNYSSGWEQRPGPHGGGYDYYGGGGGQGGGHMSDHPAPAPMSHPAGPTPNPNMGHPPQPANYNYGPTHGPDYGHQGAVPYSQTAPPPQSYGHGYDEPKYDGHGQTQHPYGHGPSQPVYPQAAAGSQPGGYGAQPQYGKPPSYGMPSQGPQPQPQSYGPPRPSQPADAPYQGAIPSSQPYGSTAPPQQQYPYPSSGPTQQSYPSYGSTGTDGYSQATGYPQQGSQPVQSYGQPGGQPATSYQGYGSYPSAQQGYPDPQAGPNSGGYGYQATQDPSAAYGSVPGSGYSAPPSGQQPSYAQPAAATQPSYDQSAPQTGAYGAAAAPVSAPAGYGKTVSPQPGYPPQYESAAQMYATPR